MCQRGRADDLIICYRPKQIDVSFSWVWRVIYSYNVMTEFIINNRADTWKTDGKFNHLSNIFEMDMDTCVKVNIIEQNFTTGSSWQGRFTLLETLGAGIPELYSRRSERGELASTFRSFLVPLIKKQIKILTFQGRTKIRIKRYNC